MNPRIKRYYSAMEANDKQRYLTERAQLTDEDIKWLLDWRINGGMKYFSQLKELNDKIKDYLKYTIYFDDTEAEEKEKLEKLNYIESTFNPLDWAELVLSNHGNNIYAKIHWTNQCLKLLEGDTASDIFKTKSK